MKLSKITLACALAAGMAAPQIASADDSFEFHGYARQGLVYEQDGNNGVGADGQTGNATGRLGNEGDGGEFLFMKKFEGENGTKWDLGIMLENWGDGIQQKQFYAGASNVFESQPNAYIWAGAVFHARMQQGLNDYYVTWADGKGAGIKGVELGFANLELGLVGAEGPNYTATSKLSGIKLGDDISMDLAALYGFSNDAEGARDFNSYHLIAKVSGFGQNFYYRRAENVSDSMSWGQKDGLTSDYFSVDGSYSLGESTGLEYLASYHSIDEPANEDDRDTMNLIVRPTHQWNDIHSTWVEAGYSLVDYDSGVENSAFKVTVSQNIAVGGVTWARPQIRFYVTAGEEENGGVTENPVLAGAMFEAWW